MDVVPETTMLWVRAEHTAPETTQRWVRAEDVGGGRGSRTLSVPTHPLMPAASSPPSQAT